MDGSVSQSNCLDNQNEATQSCSTIEMTSEFNDLETKLSDLTMQEDIEDISYEHSPLASVQEIDADDNNDLDLYDDGDIRSQRTMAASSGESAQMSDTQFQIIDNDQIIDDQQLMEHQENDKTFLFDDSLIKLFKIYRKLLEKRKTSRNGHHHAVSDSRFDSKPILVNKKINNYDLNNNKSNHGNSKSMIHQHHTHGHVNSIFDDYMIKNLNDGGIDYDNDTELMEQEFYVSSDNDDYNNDDTEDVIRINEIKSILLAGDDDRNGGCTNADLNDLALMDENDSLPKNLIVAAVPSEVFEKNNEQKMRFEKLFRDIDNRCKFCYFRIFKRCCIQYESGISAVLARFQLDDQVFLNDRLRIFLTKPIKLKTSRPFLEPPANEKTFLISPPSSPPVGWEQNFEDPPVVNLDLLAAISKLKPDEPCEIVKSTCEHMPSIVIHPCADLQSDPTDMKRKYIPTKRPAFEFT